MQSASKSYQLDTAQHQTRRNPSTTQYVIQKFYRIVIEKSNIFLYKLKRCYSLHCELHVVIVVNMTRNVTCKYFLMFERAPV